MAPRALARLGGGQHQVEAPSKSSGHPPRATTMSEIDALQQRAAENWLAKYRAKKAEPSVETGLEREKESELDRDSPAAHKIQKSRDLEHPGPEDDLEL